MAEQTSRERDLILAYNQYALIMDETKGHIVVYVGPTKQSLSNTDRPVDYSPDSKKFIQKGLEAAIHEFPSADEGDYVVLENPAKEGDHEHPGTGSNNLPKLNFGRKVNIPGPVSFPLWAGQVATVIKGHRLRSNQYSIARVYNEDSARENWQKSVMKPQVGGGETKGESKSDSETGQTVNAPTTVSTNVVMPDLTMGKLLVIKGTDVSFYIPPTGVEVVPDPNLKYVRDAVTLERLEYCILLDENGNKRFVPGPDVVFPEPTETFVEKDGSRKFRAIELNDDMGIYIKVIADYNDEEGEHKVGDELFLTGKKQKIYFPRTEHAVIRYGDQELHYAVAIPDGEARYVLGKQTGKVELTNGPQMFLPDPRKQVVVRRVLDYKTVQLWFPGNEEALEHNKGLAVISQSKSGEPVTERAVRAMATRSGSIAAETRGFVGDDFSRKQDYTPPRTITLNTKYDGAVTIVVWTGYAVMVVSKTGDRRVVVGPQTVLLDYDEILEVLSLSTGKPKSTDKLERTVYLRVKHNQVSDIVRVMTKDMVSAEVKLSYRVNFEGDPNKWFNVENYVKILTDHMRSKIKNAAKRVGIEEFNENYINIIRDTVLGFSEESKPRPGQIFEENDIRIYDVEVLDLKIGDEKISGLLVGAQHKTVEQAIDMAQQERRLRTTRRLQKIEQDIATALSETEKKKLELKKLEVEKRLEVNLAEITAEVDKDSKRREADLEKQTDLDAIDAAVLVREKAKEDQRLLVAKTEIENRIMEFQAEVEAAVKRGAAFTPDLIAALQAFADKDLAKKMAESMAPLAILGGNSVADVLSRLLKGTVLERVLMASTDGNRAELATTRR